MKSSRSTWTLLLLGVMAGFLLSASSSDPSRRILLEASADEEGSGDEEAELSVAAAIIVLVLIILTILFEKCKEALEESAPVVMTPVMEGLFGELTVLGFLSGVTFCGTQLGVFQELSSVFLHQEDQEELLETFELVHFMLFFIMVFFVVSILQLLRGAQKMYVMWWTMNNACQDPEYMKEAREAASTSRPWWKHLLPDGMINTFAEDIVLYAGLRKEFLLERSVEPPFAPSNPNPDESFEFGRYLFVALAHTLGHVVHLHMTTWWALAVVTVVFYFIQWSIDFDLKLFAWIWAGTGWLCFLFVAFFERHLHSILTHMAATAPASTSNDSEAGALLSSDLPPWTKIDVEKYMQQRPMITRLGALMPSGHGHHSHDSHGDHHGHHGHDKVTRQNTLYWMEAEGPHFYTTLFQIQLLFTSAYISLLVASFLPFVYASDESPGEKVAFTIVSLLPVLLLLSKSEVAARKMAIVSSIGCHKRPRIMAQVERARKTAKSIRSIVMLLKLQALAHDDDGSVPVATSSAPMSRRHAQAASAAFDFYDDDGDGCIQGKKLRAIFEKMGMVVTDSCFQNVMKLLDGDNNGHVTKAEFLRFYQSYMIMEMDDASLRTLSHQVFEMFDIDGSGYVTVSEFMKIVQNFNIGFTIDEVAELLGGLDPEDNGQVGKSGFEYLFLERQRLLFKEAKLPSLS